MVRSLTSWLWLVDFHSRDRALDASDDMEGDLAAALAGHFGSVDVLRSDGETAAQLRTASAREGWPVPAVTIGSVDRGGWSSATFDCICVHDALTRKAQSTEALLGELGSLHRLLKRDGWLEIAATGRPRWPSGAPSAGITHRKLAGLLTRAGFQEVRCYFVEHLIDRPLILIPNSHPTFTAYEGSDTLRGQSQRRRRIASRLGLRSLLYSKYLLIARA
jgi:hypothetical protein